VGWVVSLLFGMVVLASLVRTSFGITAGVAIMLSSFGASVLRLYRKRMERYSVGREKPQVAAN